MSTHITVDTTYEEYNRLKEIEERFRLDTAMSEKFKNALLDWARHFEKFGWPSYHFTTGDKEDYNALKVLVECLNQHGIDPAFLIPSAMNSFKKLGYKL